MRAFIEFRVFLSPSHVKEPLVNVDHLAQCVKHNARGCPFSDLGMLVQCASMYVGWNINNTRFEDVRIASLTNVGVLRPLCSSCGTNA